MKLAGVHITEFPSIRVGQFVNEARRRAEQMLAA